MASNIVSDNHDVPVRDSWWFFVEELASLAKTASGNQPKPAEPVVDLEKATPEELDKLVWKVLGEKGRWAPFASTDRDLLETSHATDNPDKTVAVSGQSGQRLWLADLATMEMTPMYWKGGTQVPLRRSTWILMNSQEDDRQGGIPAPLDWETLLEHAFSDSYDQMATEEVAVAMSGLLGNYNMVLKPGNDSSVQLVPKPGLTIKSMLSNAPPRSIRLIRGYRAYYSAVVTALQDPVTMLNNPPTAPGMSPPQPKPIVKSIPSPFEEPSSNGPRVPKHVIYVVHGIGQKLAEKVGHGFTAAVNSLRRYMLSYASQMKFDLDDVYILPIQWRVDLDMGSGYFAPSSNETEESEFDSLVTAITIPTVPAVRTLATDVTMDVLLYMTPRHFNRIVDACVKEIRRVHGLFTKHNPSYQDTKFSIIGHSLGSALVFDIVGFQLDHEMADIDSIDTCVEATEKRLGFEVENYFSLGSPLSLFMLLKHIKPIACVKRDDIAETLEAAIQDYKSYQTESHPRMGFLACKQLFNLFMPYDPVAYRMEPLVVPPEHRHEIINPKRVQYCKGGMTGLKIGMSEKFGKTKQDMMDAMNRSLPQWFKQKLSTSESDLQLELNSPIIETSSLPGSLLRRFNLTGRIDYQLQDSIMESAYLSSLSSHFSYWHDEDVANFILKQLIESINATDK